MASLQYSQQHAVRVFQLNGDATFKVCRCTVALLAPLCLGVNSHGNVNNTIFLAIVLKQEALT